RCMWDHFASSRTWCPPATTDPRFMPGPRAGRSRRGRPKSVAYLAGAAHARACRAVEGGGGRLFRLVERCDEPATLLRREPGRSQAQAREELATTEHARLGWIPVRRHGSTREAHEGSDPRTPTRRAFNQLRDGGCAGTRLPARVAVHWPTVEGHVVAVFLDKAGMRFRLDGPHAGWTDHDVIDVEPVERDVVDHSEGSRQERQDPRRRQLTGGALRCVSVAPCESASPGEGDPEHKGGDGETNIVRCRADDGPGQKCAVDGEGNRPLPRQGAE